MASEIPIANVYYLLGYAWDQLDQADLIQIDQYQGFEIAELLTAVLCDGVRHAARRGLDQSYQTFEEELAGVRGRIDFSASLRKVTFLQGRAFCNYDEISSNTIANQIIKTTLAKMNSLDGLNSDLRKRAKFVLRGLPQIDTVDLTQALFRRARASANARLYKFLLNVCELIHGCLNVDEQTGRTQFRDFSRDDRKMAQLFQRFLANFIAKEFADWEVKSENIAWMAESETDPKLTRLPRMQTDISVLSEDRYLIIDAKYYRSAVNSYFDVEKFHSGNLYQVVSYLQNAPVRNGLQAVGMLIYPRVEKTLRDRYEILGRPVSLCTLDLNQHWSEIDRELRELLS